MFSAAPALTTTSLRQTRRRLSLVSDNKLIEGLSALGIKEVETTRASAQPLPHSYARFCGVSRKGYAAYNPRKRNQDSILMEEHRATGSLLLGVFDGHGEAGDLVSRFFSDRLPLALYKNAKFAADPSGALVEELDRIEQLLLSDVSIDSEFSGTTGVVGILRGSMLHVCNIGDSRVILGCREPAAAAGAALKVEALTQDHKPDLPGEKARILAAGGRVHEVGCEDGGEGDGLGIARVWLGDMDIPGIAMSRSLGDSVVHTVGVISAPEVHHLQLLPSHAFLVWASDGLWEFMSNQEVLDMVAQAERSAAQGSSSGGSGSGTGSSSSSGGGGGSSSTDFLKVAVEGLIEESSKRWLANEHSAIDDTTVILVQLDVPAGSGSPPALPAAAGAAPAPRRASLQGGLAALALGGGSPAKPSSSSSGGK